MAKKRALMVAGAPLRWDPDSARAVTEAPILLAADGGANHLARLGLRPAAVIGDLDSISSQTRRWLGDEVLVHRPDQDRTDLDKALEHAFGELGVEEVTVLGALGGRPDHEVGNLGLLARLGMGEDLVFSGDGCRVVAVSEKAALDAEPGEIWSFWTFDPGVRVDITGVRWPVENAPIDAAGRPSVSNEATEKTIHIRAEGGSVVVYRDLGPTSSS